MNKGFESRTRFSEGYSEINRKLIPWSKNISMKMSARIFLFFGRGKRNEKQANKGNRNKNVPKLNSKMTLTRRTLKLITKR
jgi:hypothetical protein